MKLVTAIEGKAQPVKRRRRYPVGGARHQDADLIVEIGRGLAIDLLDVVLFNVNPRESHNAEVLANIQALLEGSGAEPFEALIRPPRLLLSRRSVSRRVQAGNRTRRLTPNCGRLSGVG